MEDASSHYTPGKCNIGKQEINARKKWLVVTLLALITFTYLCFDRPGSPWLKTFLFASSFAFIIIYLEVRQKFCVLFGMAGYFNFDKTGETEKVTDKRFLIKDREKVLRIIVISFIFALLFMLLVSLLSTLLL